MQLRVLSSFCQRLRGLHACERPVGDKGVWLLKCACIHTCLLPYTIDVLFLDDRDRVVACREGLKPNRVAWHWRAASVIELEDGYCSRHPDYALEVRMATASFRAGSRRRQCCNWHRKR